MPSDQIGMTSTLENFAVLPSEVVTELWRGLTSGRYLALLRSRLAAFAARFAAFFTLRCLATMRRRSRSVTADGYDACSYFNVSCGISAFPFASWMKDFLHVETAMEMDQGGSTTMWIRGEGRDGVVSCSQDEQCNGRPRRLFDGLFGRS